MQSNVTIQEYLKAIEETLSEIPEDECDLSTLLLLQRMKQQVKTWRENENQN